LRKRISLFGTGILCGIFLAVACASAQQNPPPSEADTVIAFFYKDPKPERLYRVIEQLENQPAGGKWETYPPVAGLLTVIFQSHPDQIEKLLSAAPGAKTAETVAAALQLSGNAALIPQLLPQLQNAGRDSRLVEEFSELPSRLEDLQIRSPTHLDILWGASFASGDPKFVQMIIDFYARTANRSEGAAIDIVKTAISIAGGPEGPKLGPKYGDDVGRQIVYAAIALWALGSNSQQHEFVNGAVGQYIDGHPGTPATKGLSVVTGRKL
jgi:hypothetical protein